MRSPILTPAALFLIACSSDPVSGPRIAVDAPLLVRASAGYTVQDISLGNPGDAHAWSIC